MYYYAVLDERGIVINTTSSETEPANDVVLRAIYEY